MDDVNELEKERFQFERDKFEREYQLREREIALKEKEALYGRSKITTTNRIRSEALIIKDSSSLYETGSLRASAPVKMLTKDPMLTSKL